jgi:iron complex outermembrane receptor protein
VDTRTFGADIILSYFYQRSDHKIQATFAGNINRMDIRNIKTNDKLQGKEDIYFGNREQLFLLASAPPSKLNLTLDYSFKKFNTMIRLVRFAGIELEDFTGEIDQYDPRITTDLSVGYRINNHLQIIAGGSNIFNVYPTMQNTETETGGLWDPVQMGFNGAFFFGRLSVRF